MTPSPTAPAAPDPWAAARLILIASAVVLAVALGIRHGFGLFLQPVSMANGWGREVFAFAIALQNLVWGVAQPVAGLLADRHGAARVVAGGALLFAAGMVLMALSQDVTLFVLGAGVLIGLGLSGTGFPVVFGAVARAVPAEKRSAAMGIVMAAGSFGQFAMLPLALGLIQTLGPAGALLLLAVAAAAMVPLGTALAGRGSAGAATLTGPSAAQALRDAAASRDFWLLSLGFFVCGFQVVFIAVHLPAFLADEGLAPGVATLVLALIGLFNIAGTYTAGLWGGTRSKPMLLAGIYLARAVVIAVFLVLPVTALSAYGFGIAMGLVWLSTVPLTNGVVASVFGLRHMAMLGGVVFLAHQIGAFLGGWLGGALYDQTGSYAVVWWIAIALSLIAAALNLPIRERPVARAAPAEGPA